MSFAEKETETKKPVACLVVGMAGSGKTTFMARLNAELSGRDVGNYVLNLDPAVAKLPYEPNIDIRDTVNMAEIMKTHKLGPNGAILTSLNLFTTRFDQVLRLCEQRQSEIEVISVDTPGQIEVFTWSASGMIITDALASSFPTVLLYIVDTPRVTDPVTFMANMTYACSILYKTRLPMLIVFNKTDVVSHEFAAEWMTDFESFQESLRECSSYSSSLARSLSLVMDEFYRAISSVGVSSYTGLGFDGLLEALEGCAEDYYTSYVPYRQHMEQQAAEKRIVEREAKESELKGDYDCEEDEERKAYEEFKSLRMEDL